MVDAKNTENRFICFEMYYKIKCLGLIIEGNWHVCVCTINEIKN